MARPVIVSLTRPQAEAILEMLCHASGLCGDGKEHDLAVYERAAVAVSEGLHQDGSR